ncbi:Transcriptional regulatory protein [Caenorhabditis elegans]|uniref:Transcriptional regulatory protein n=1 Tax=Caenorhabditis elegans TaxID=6239 RepID=Q965T4_CAEEL|nr:Transcriptional regulatory protein [Caenorhabditis elegans]CCD73796.1 Transcriptional regulatory protein [Caenorhabditis elegans]|eukprot:NP_497183.1 Translational Activator of Cytochrome c Oxidase [Caenorhabditis elegans]
MFSPLRRLTTTGLQLQKLQKLQKLQQFQPARAVHLTVFQQKGHSKWQNIKAVKGKNDLIRSKATNFLLRKVRGAVSRGGFDMKLNRELADLESEFRAQGLPLDTLKNFLQKMKDKPEVEYSFDIIGPSGIFLIVTAETSNKKAFENDLRKYFNKLGGFRLAADGGVRSWFEEKGVVHVDTKKGGKILNIEEMEEIGLEFDAEEVLLIEEDSTKKFELICDAKSLQTLENGLGKGGFSILQSEIEFRPVHPIDCPEAEEPKVQKLYEMLQEDEQVRQIFDNITPDE